MLWYEDTPMKKTVRIYDSFEQENEADARRRASMTPEQRMQEFSELQERVWGDKLRQPIVKIATWEADTE